MMSFSAPWVLIGWHLHIIFGALALFGGILLLVWAARQKDATVKQWGSWALILGILGILFTSQFSFFGWGMMQNESPWRGMMGNQFWNNNQP